MILNELYNQGLYGNIEFRHDSYIVRIYRSPSAFDADSIRPIYIVSFGNGVAAEDCLLDMLEHPSWTALKFG